MYAIYLFSYSTNNSFNLIKTFRPSKILIIDNIHIEQLLSHFALIKIC